MKYLIDGYNWFFRKNYDDKDFCKDHDKFIAKIIVITSHIKGNCTIVFDGNGVFTSFSKKGIVDIVYTSKNQTADEYIIESINDSNITVVSSDKGLCQEVLLKGANVLSIETFEQECKKKHHERSSESDKLIVDDKLLREFYIKTFTESLKNMNQNDW